VSSTPELWPSGARAAVSITVDNLGEAAEIELGLRDRHAPPGGHYSVTTALPIMLELLTDSGLNATFFVEGVNAETYPDALCAIRDAGHELAYHAWCHEEWSALQADAEAANLDRGLAALGAIGIDALGLRPPGGRLTPRTLGLLSSRGLSYCSPAGSAPGLDRVAVLPFAWPAVDAYHVLPAFAALRERITGSGEPAGPDAIRAALLRSVENALLDGAHSVLVLHTWMIELARDAVRDVLARIQRGVDDGELWAAPCREVAAWMIEHAPSFGAPPKLENGSWAGPTSSGSRAGA
jgi:peptidoglycan/xylan/chitin deacetylase (PgdA/CDA1 family)